MVNRQNYHYARQYLDYLADVTQLDPRSVDRYWFYLKHFLIWADEAALNHIANIPPPFPST